MAKPTKKPKNDPTIPVVSLSWEEACAIDFDEIGFIHPEEEETSLGVLVTPIFKDGEDHGFVHIPPKPHPKIFDISGVDKEVRELIDSIISCGHDPIAKHCFYVKVDELLYDAQDNGLITANKEQIDSLWVKYDSWALCAYDSIKEMKNRDNQRELANDLFKQAPHPPSRTPFNKRKCVNKFLRKFKRTGGTNNKHPVINRKQCLASKVLYDSLLKAQERGTISIRDDLSLRREFFDKFPHFIDKDHEPFMDFYWNALLYRNLDYYERAKEHKRAKFEKRNHSTTEKCVLPPDIVGSCLEKLRSFISVDYETRTFKTFTTPCRKLDLDRLVKKAINDCILLAKDPRESHHFYWTAHLALQAKCIVDNLPMSDDVKDEYWSTWDTWANEAWQVRTPLQIDETIEESDKYYKQVTHLPISARKRLRYYPAPDGTLVLETKATKHLSTTKLIQKLHTSVMDIARSYVGGRHLKTKTDLCTRREFLESYATFVPAFVEESVVDEYWRKLVNKKKQDDKLDEVVFFDEGDENESSDENEEQEKETRYEVGTKEAAIKYEVEDIEVDRCDDMVELDDVEIKQEVESD